VAVVFAVAVGEIMVSVKAVVFKEAVKVRAVVVPELVTWRRFIGLATATCAARAMTIREFMTGN